MKKIALIVALVITAGLTFAQKNNRTTAFNFLRNGKLDKAKEYIDKTVEHPQTINDARAWFYRGNIYLAIHMSDIPAYKSLDPNALEVAYASYKKSRELDTKKEYFADILTNMFVISEQYYNKGVETYNKSDFIASMNAFKNCVEVTRELGSLDTMAFYNSAMTAELAEKYDYAKNTYKELLQMGFQNASVYASLGSILLKEHDTVAAMSYIKRGRGLFPDDFNLLIYETNVYLNTKQFEDALRNLKQAVEIDKNNPTIFFAVGTIYDQMKSAHPQEAKQYFELAESSYKKAIEIDPNYFDPNYNLGALFVNEAAVLIEKANALPLSEMKKYEELKSQADALLIKSLPYLEKAHEINPTDLNTMVSLKEIYTRLNRLEDLKVINTKIRELQQK